MSEVLSKDCYSSSLVCNLLLLYDCHLSFIWACSKQCSCWYLWLGIIGSEKNVTDIYITLYIMYMFVSDTFSDSVVGMCSAQLHSDLFLFVDFHPLCLFSLTLSCFLCSEWKFHILRFFAVSPFFFSIFCFLKCDRWHQAYFASAFYYVY